MRQSTQFDPSNKEFESFLDFSGGWNSEISNERLKENEFPTLNNVDLSGRASARRRYGRVKLASLAGKSQGMFFFYRQDIDHPDIIAAIAGKLYYVDRETGAKTHIPIKNGTESDIIFQTEKPIEAVQYQESLFVATGTKFSEVYYEDGYKARVVEPYTPSVLEAIYIGTNGLATNPDSYVEDGVSTNLELVGIKPFRRTGTVNQPMTMTAYINKPPSVTTVEYKWEYKKSSETEWKSGQDWAAVKTYTFLPDTATKWDIRVGVRENATSTEEIKPYVLTSFQVNQVEDKANNTAPIGGIQTCRKIVLHWDRLILSGDEQNPYQAYISDVLNPKYFPVTNTISFDTGKQEPVTAMVRFQDLLVFFTKTTIQTLVGKSIEDYQRFLIHDGIGCISGRSAKVVGNIVVFHSHEGIYALKPNPYRLETMNVSRVDAQIKSDIFADEDSCAIVNDSQYWLCFPQRKVIYRLYYESGVWVRDTSSKLDISQFLTYGDEVFNITTMGEVYQHSKTVYSDDGEVYDMIIETKYHDLSKSFNFKKLKKLYIMLRTRGETGLYVSVYADMATVFSPDDGKAVVSGDGYVTWQPSITPNFVFKNGTILGSWILGESAFGDLDVSVGKSSVRGKCRRVKFKVEHRQDDPCELYGFGLEFKYKKA